jgi:hypothetical protein
MSKKLLTFRVYLIRSKGEYLEQVKAQGRRHRARQDAVGDTGGHVGEDFG